MSSYEMVENKGGEPTGQTAHRPVQMVCIELPCSCGGNYRRDYQIPPKSNDEKQLEITHVCSNCKSVIIVIDDAYPKSGWVEISNDKLAPSF